MSISHSLFTRREALRISGATVAALAQRGAILGQGKQPEPPADSLIEQKPRDITPLPLNADDSARLFTDADLTPVADIGVLYRNTGGKAPDIEHDAAKAHIRIRGNVSKQTGGLGLAELKKLPFVTQITRLQCGTPKPSGVVKWGGVRFADVCRMLGVQPMGQYAMFISADKYSTVEDMTVAMHPQVMLAWEMNGGPLPPVHGAPYRLVLPFRWGARSLKAVDEIRFTASSFGANSM